MGEILLVCEKELVCILKFITNIDHCILEIIKKNSIITFLVQIFQIILNQIINFFVSDKNTVKD